MAGDNTGGKFDWHLAWLLAEAICERFYCSHGIAPNVICKEGLGFYGIAMIPISCSVHGRSPTPVGRLTIGGDVENWITGCPGDHGLALEGRKSEPTEQLLSAAISHLRLSTYPLRSHHSCHHARKGRSFVLVFRLAAILAQKHGQRLKIWNAPYEVDEVARRVDAEFHPSSDPGYFLFDTGEQRVLVSGDGRLLLPPGRSLWDKFMGGDTEQSLIRGLETLLKLENSQ